MTDVACITAPPESFTSATTPPDYQRSSHEEDVKLEPSDNRGPESSPTRSGAGDTQASSADEGKNQDINQRAGPSMTVSGASSVSGNGTIASSLGPHFSQPLTAKKGPQSFFSGSKIKHLKKQDGIPLWRSDIQYDFLQAVFKDTEPVFSNSYTDEKNLSFADIYVDAMARSSKTSKILRDKLLTERGNALNMAMVCLLVNVGRMNTTLNFFPEMKAQLRTYHAIPSLQAHTDSSAYKQLQDAPRLKSILKGACEDRKEPQTLDQIMNQKAPRTNPINLVFILSTYAPKISEMHFPENMDFYDLIMRATLSSKSRAKCFLWLMWLYLESDFSEEACLKNPYGKGKPIKNDTIPWCVPDFEYLTEEQAAKENVDTEVEKEFGEQKRQERKRLLGDIQNAPPGVGRGRGRKSTILASPDMQSPGVSPPPSRRRTHPRQGFPEAYEYESEPQTRSGSPEIAFQTPANGNKGNRRISSVKIPNILNSADFASSPMDMSQSVKHKGGRPKASAKRTADGELKPAQRIILKSGGKQLATTESMGYNITASRSILPSDRSSPMLERLPRHRMTSHQMAVQQNRQDRVDYIINRKLRRLDKKRKRMRIKTGAISRAWARIKDIQEPLYMSDDDSKPLTFARNTNTDGTLAEKHGHEEDGSHPAKRARVDKNLQSKGLIEKSRIGPAGLLPRETEEHGDDDDDFGEEAMGLAAALRRSKRRMERWEEEDRRRAAAGFVLVDESRAVPDQTVSGVSAAEQGEQNAGVATEEDDGDEDMPEAAQDEESDADIDME